MNSNIKTKRMTLAQLHLRYHPTVEQLICHDHFTAGSPVELHTLSPKMAQVLLDASPLLVCPSSEDNAVDWQLNINPTVALLKQHPAAQQLTATMLYYPESMLPELLIGNLLLAPALHYRQRKDALTHLYYRSEQAKTLLPASPSKKTLAAWAGVKPSAIRRIKEYNG